MSCGRAFGFELAAAKCRYGEHAPGYGLAQAQREEKRVDDDQLRLDEGQIRVVDNPVELRYELWVGTERAGLIAYRREPGVVVLVHTEIDPAYEGKGLGSRLVSGAVADLRRRGLRLVPLCPFVAAYLRRHPEDADLVVDDPRPGD
jgi:uncharacterized protein